MTERRRKPNEPHDQFIKQFVPVVLKNLFESQTSVSVQLSEELAIDVLCIAIVGGASALPNRESQVIIDDSLGLLGRLVAIHPTIIIEHYSNYLDLEDIDSCILRSAIYWELNKLENTQEYPKYTHIPRYHIYPFTLQTYIYLQNETHTYQILP